MKQRLPLPHLHVSHSLHHFSSDFHHNAHGIVIGESEATVKANMEDVKSNFNGQLGISLRLGEGSDVTLNNVEASYNAYDNHSFGGLYVDTFADVILKGTNSFIGNKGTYGLSAFGNIKIVVSRGATLNAYNNTGNGVLLSNTTPTLTVKKRGAVNACGNDVDLDGPGSSSFFPSDGKRYTCDDVVDNGNGFTSCDNTCPVCA